MTTNIYAHYGVLAHEKQPVYSTAGKQGDLCDKLTVEIPFPTWRNYMDEIGVTIDGRDYLLDTVLTNWGDKPAIVWNDGQGGHHVILQEVGK